MDVFHLVFHELANAVDFVLGNFEDEFIVDLKRHARF